MTSSAPWQQLYTWDGSPIKKATELTCLSRVLLTNDVDFVRHMVYRVSVIVSKATITKFAAPERTVSIRPDTPPPLGAFYVPPSDDECAREGAHLCAMFDRYLQNRSCYLTIARFWVLWNYATSDSVRMMVNSSHVTHGDEPATMAHAAEDPRTAGALTSMRVALRNSMLNIVHVSGIGVGSENQERERKRVSNANPSVVVAAATMMYASGAVFASEWGDVLDCI